LTISDDLENALHRAFVAVRGAGLKVAGLVGAILLSGCATVPDLPGLDIRQALAPKGKLRVALILGAPANAIRDPASGEMKGVGYDLGIEFAKRLGVPFEPVLYPAVGALFDDAKREAWDVTFNGVTSEREKYLDYTSPHLEIEFGYLVRVGSSLSTAADVDRPGVRIVVPEKGALDSLLSRKLKNATMIRAAGLPGALQVFKSGGADAFGANKANLFQMMDQVPGSRVLDGGPGTETQALLIPKAGHAGLAYARTFIEDAKARGLVKAAIDRAGLQGAHVADRHEGP